MCRSEFPIVYTEQQTITKSIHAFRQAFLVFVKHESEFRAKYGTIHDSMFNEIHDKYVVTICELEEKLQNILTPQSRNARQRDLQYQCHKMDNLILVLYLMGLSRESTTRPRPPRGYSQNQTIEYAEQTMRYWIYRNVRHDGCENMGQVELIQYVRDHFVNCFENNAFEIQWFLNFFDSYEACLEVFNRMLGIMYPNQEVGDVANIGIFGDESGDVANIGIFGDELADAVELQNVENLEDFDDVFVVAEPV